VDGGRWPSPDLHHAKRNVRLWIAARTFVRDVDSDRIFNR
jgi:hypothetical protein